MLRLRLPSKQVQLQRHSRSLHDNGIHGFQRPPPSSPALGGAREFTADELANRARSGSLLRLVESYRVDSIHVCLTSELTAIAQQKHGHRAARLDPLDLALRPSVPALDPRRYGFALETASQLRPEFISETLPEPVEGLTDEQGKVDVQGILDFPADESGEKKSIEEVQKRLEEVYCEGIGYEVRFS
jgi:probable 2-oxoglutarate dehydrogenase E1 component DHKTD1